MDTKLEANASWNSTPGNGPKWVIKSTWGGRMPGMQYHDVISFAEICEKVADILWRQNRSELRKEFRLLRVSLRF